MIQPSRILHVLRTTFIFACTHDACHSYGMLSRFFVLDEHLSFLAISLRRFLGNSDDIEDGCGLAEDGVHLLQGAVGGFGVEEVDDGEHEGVTGESVSFSFYGQEKHERW